MADATAQQQQQQPRKSVQPRAESTASEPLLRTPKKQQTFLAVASFILVNEFCERLAFYGIVSGLPLFFKNELGMGAGYAAVMAFVFAGTCYVTPVLGGWVADSWLGRYKTILLFISIYFVGMCALTMGVVYKMAWLVFVALFIVALGTGGIKPNVSAFGADQFPRSNAKARQTFFRWFYWMVNLGAFTAFIGVGYVQQNVSFSVGFAIPTVSMGISIVAFICGRSRYLMVPPSGSVVVRTTKIIGQGCCCKPKGLVQREGDGCLDAAKVSRGGTFLSDEVEQVKELGSILPVMATFVLYWTLDNQISTVFLLQGEVMDLHLVSTKEIPVAGLAVFDAAIIIALIPLLDKVVYPWMERRDITLSMLQRIGIGYLMAVGSMILAGLVEMVRLRHIHNQESFVQNVAGSEIVAAKMSVFWQAPQYLLVGASEVFAATTGLEFAYSQSPRPMRSVVMAIFLLTNGVGDFIGGGILSLVNAITAPHKWIPANLNKGRLDLYFYLLAVIEVVNIAALYFVSRRYRYKSSTPLPPTATPKTKKRASRLDRTAPLAHESPRGPMRKSQYDARV